MSDWEDVAYGEPVSSSDGWEDVAYGEPAPTLRQSIENQAGLGTKAASGYLSGLSGLGDLFGTVADMATGGNLAKQREIENLIASKGLVSQEQYDAEKTKGIGDYMRSGLDWATGVEDSTGIGRGGLAHKVGEYLPSTMMGGGNILNGVKGTVLNLAKLLGANTALGTAGYVGNEVGGLPGEVAATLTTALAPTAASKGIGSIKNLLAPNLTAQADDATRATLAQFTDIDQLPETLAKIKPNQFTPMMRTAEQAQDPGLALLTKTLEKNIPEAGAIGLAKDISRENLRAGIFNAAQGGTISKETAGKLVRQGLQENQQALTKSIGTQYNKAMTTKGTVPIQTVKMAVSDAVEAEMKFGLGIDPSTAKFVEKFKELPANAPLATVNMFRKKAGGLIGDLRGNLSKTPEQNSSMNVLRTMFGGLDEAERFATTAAAQGVTKTGIKKGISGGAAKALEKGRELTKARGETFGKGAAGNILKQDQFKQFKIPDSKVLGKAVSTPEDARQIIKGLKGKTENKQALQAGLMEELSLRGSDSKGLFTAARFANNWKKIRPVADEVLTKTQINAIDRVKNDLMSRANLDAIASNASKGQSITAQSMGTAGLVKEVFTNQIKNRSGIFGKMADYIVGNNAAEIKAIVDKNLIEIAFNPKFAQDFLTKPTPQAVERISKELTARLGAAILPTTSGLARSSTEPSVVQSKSLLSPEQSSDQSNKQKEKQLTESSFNSKLDSIVNQQVDKAMKTPEIVSVKRTSSKIADDSFIDKEEGGQRLKAYNPPAKGSGITVSTGVDLGQWSKQDLENAGVSSKVISKVKPYLGLKDATARAKLKEQPLTLTKAEADELDEAVKTDIYGAVELKLKSEGVNINKLPAEAQTVIKSISYNFGKNFDEKLPTIWKAIVNKDWSKVQSLLINTKWKQPELLARRKREAELLSRIV